MTRFKYLLPISLCMLLLTGCWDQNELDELSIVMGIGINKDNNGNLLVSYQVVNPSQVTPGVTGGGGGKQPAFTVYQSKGKTLMDATRNASKQTSRRLFFAHARILVISEKIAKENLYDVLDMMSRDPEVRSTIQVLIARETTPSVLLQTFSPIDKITSDEVASELKISEEVWGENLQHDINEVLQMIINEGGEPLINGLVIDGDKDLAITTKNYEVGDPSRVKLSGMAVFKNGKLKGWLDDDEARGNLFVKGRIKSSAITIDCNKKKDAVAIEIVRSKTSLRASVKGKIPTVNIDVYPEANIAEANCAINLEKQEEILKLEKVFNKEVEKEITKTVAAAQGYNSDVLGLGELLYRTHSKKWLKTIKPDYDRIFPQIKVNVHVDSRIRRAGIRTSPFLLEQQEEDHS